MDELQFSNSGEGVSSRQCQIRDCRLWRMKGGTLRKCFAQTLEFVKRQDSLFDSHMIQCWLLCEANIRQCLATHQKAGILCNRVANCFGNKRHCPRGSRVCFNNVHLDNSYCKYCEICRHHMLPWKRKMQESVNNVTTADLGFPRNNRWYKPCDPA